MAKSHDSEPDLQVESEEESEEESSSGEETEGSESESEPEPPKTLNSEVAKKPTPAPAAKKPEPMPSKTQPEHSSSDDEESESETDSGAPSKTAGPSIKPIASKPMDDSQKTPTATKPRSKSKATGPTSPTKPVPAAGAKRPLGAAGVSDGDAKEAKRSKKKSETGVESSEKKGINDSKKLFQRLWSEDDEIAILNGMIDYQAKKKADPVADLNAFLEFIKKSLHIDVSKTQLQDKIRRLKKKYVNNASKETRDNEKQFSKPHEQKSYDLSKKIWGTENHDKEHSLESPKVNGTAVRKSRTRNPSALTPKLEEQEETVKEDQKSGDVKSVEGLKGVHIGLGSSGIEDWIAKNGMELIKGEKREEMEEKWKKLNVEEVELYAKKLELMLQQTKCVLEAMKSSGH